MTDIQKENKSGGKVPNLRFPSFEGEWEVKKLGEIAEKIGDGLHGTPSYTDESNYYFINGNNLINGKIEITENTKKIDAKTFLKNDKNLRKNTLLISMNGTIGNIALYNDEKIAYFVISQCKDDSTKLVGELKFYNQWGNFFKSDTIIYKCK